MNEFIVWDIKEKRFYRMCSFSCGNEVTKPLVRVSGKESYILNEECEVFNYIGKTDINNKKIYADSSIVEFDYKGEKLKGFFRYSKMRLSYVIEDIHNDMREMQYNGEQKNIKIIDTIQENKLGLK